MKAKEFLSGLTGPQIVAIIRALAGLIGLVFTPKQNVQLERWMKSRKKFTLSRLEETAEWARDWLKRKG